MLADLAAVVECESPSADRAATAACGDVFEQVVAARLGAGSAERIVVAGCTHLRWQFGGPTSVLVVGHLDTVWPAGTLARWPFAIDSVAGTATGPGIFDMKAGLIQAVHALSLLEDLTGITLLVTADEELGSPTSRDLVISSAASARAALVCEPSASGALKTARKGIALYDLAIVGRAAHAGLEPEKGANAAVALAHAVLNAVALAAPDRGTTVTPTVLSAGTTANTVPATAAVHLDVRAAETAEIDRVDRAVRQLAAELPAAVAGTSAVVQGGVNRPPLPAAASAELFGRAQRIAADLGLPPLRAVAVGGGSDGNFTAGAGIPTLDGLGAVGDGAHAEGEHIVVAALADRAALLTGLLADLRC